MNERIVFLGTPDISAYVLNGLVENGFNIVGVVTKEDKVRGRNNKVEESPVAKMAHELNLPVHKPHRLNKDFETLKAEVLERKKAKEEELNKWKEEHVVKASVYNSGSKF